LTRRRLSFTFGNNNMNEKNGKFLIRTRKAYGWSKHQDKTDLEFIRMAHRHNVYAMLSAGIVLFSNTFTYMSGRQRAAKFGYDNTTTEAIFLILVALCLVVLFIRYRRSEECRSEIEDLYIESDKTHGNNVAEQVAASNPSPANDSKWEEPF